MQRYHTADSERAAARSVWLGALLYVPISLMFFAIGTAAFAHYRTHPELRVAVHAQKAEEKLREEGTEITPAAIETRAAELGDADVGDLVLPHYIVHAMPPGLAGLLIAAILAAAMSSIDTSLNSSATVVHADVWKRYVHPEADDRESMRVLHTATVLFGVVGTAAALAMIGVKSVLQVWWDLSSTFAGGMVGLFLLGRLVPRAGRTAAIAGVVVGTKLQIWISFSKFLPETFRSPFASVLSIVFGTLAILLVGFLVSLVTPGNDERTEAALLDEGDS